jgi:hypothetical protein
MGDSAKKSILPILTAAFLAAGSTVGNTQGSAYPSQRIGAIIRGEHAVPVHA